MPEQHISQSETSARGSFWWQWLEWDPSPKIGWCGSVFHDDMRH